MIPDISSDRNRLGIIPHASRRVNAYWFGLPFLPNCVDAQDIDGTVSGYRVAESERYGDAGMGAARPEPQNFEKPLVTPYSYAVPEFCFRDDIANGTGWIDDAQLVSLGDDNANTEYSAYLQGFR